MNSDLSDALRSQCMEQCERCLYTSTTLLVWLRTLRLLRIVFIVLPIIFGSLASWDLLSGNPRFGAVTAVFALIAGLVPAVYAGLKLDEHLPTAARLAGEYKNLEIIFSDLGNSGPKRPIEEFDQQYNKARDRLEAANSEAYTTPEWCFRRARKKIKAGHYTFNKQ